MKRHECDVLVVGSGAGGLATAVAAAHRRLDVLVVEKEPVFGGTTARSGGWMWIPCNGPAQRAGVQDSLAAARRYLQHEAGEHFDAARVDAFLETGPRAVEFFERETALQFDLGPTFADYHPDAPGGVDGGRSIVARPFDGRELGPEIRRLRPPLSEITFLGMMIGSGKELLHFFNVLRSPVSAGYVVRPVHQVPARQALPRPADAADERQCTGRSAGEIGLREGRADLDQRSGARADPRRHRTRDRRRVQADEGPVKVHARRGVVLAAGGFPQDPVRRKELMPHAPSGHEHASPAPPGNTPATGLRLGEASAPRSTRRCRMPLPGCRSRARAARTARSAPFRISSTAQNPA
jgi:hypothetical protein